MDTRDVLVVTPTGDGSYVDLDEQLSNCRMDDWFAANGPRKVGVVGEGAAAWNAGGQPGDLIERC